MLDGLWRNKVVVVEVVVVVAEVVVVEVVVEIEVVVTLHDNEPWAKR